MRWVLDASVAVEILLRTPLGDRAWEVLRDDDLLAPDLLDAEVLAVLRRENLSGRLGDERAAIALADLGDWTIERIPDADLLEAAWSLRHNVSAYDALYVATAQLHGATLVTADGPLSRVAGLAVPIHHVRG